MVKNQTGYIKYSTEKVVVIIQDLFVLINENKPKKEELITAEIPESSFGKYTEEKKKKKQPTVKPPLKAKKKKFTDEKKKERKRKMREKKKKEFEAIDFDDLQDPLAKFIGKGIKKIEIHPPSSFEATTDDDDEPSEVIFE